MKHYLVTRFCIREPSWHNVIDDAWMTHRLQLFKRYCLPSVIAQTNQDFVWILLVDEETDPKWLSALKELKYPFRILLTTTNWLKELQGSLKRRGYIITTRLDNDDAIHPKFMEIIKSAFVKCRRLFVDLPHGYQLADGVIYKHYEIGAPFTSLIEIGRDTIYSVPHGRRILEEKRIILDQPYWLQVIHERNYSNKLNGQSIDKTPNWIKEYL